MKQFRMTKWYVDYVTESGEVYIGYLAQLHLGMISFWLTSYLAQANGRRQTATFPAFRRHIPGLTSDQFCWIDERAGRAITYNRCMPSILRELVSSGAGSIRWHCHMPSATATVTKTNAAPVQASGYVESLTMKVSLEELGLQRLFWGRFISDIDSIVWIRWDGDQPLTLAYHNSIEQSNVVIADDHVVIGDNIRLTWTHDIVLREGCIQSSILSRAPLAAKLIPKSLRAVEERKLLSCGAVHQTGRLSSTGWVIHEQVTFGS